MFVCLQSPYFKQFLLPFFSVCYGKSSLFFIVSSTECGNTIHIINRPMIIVILPHSLVYIHFEYLRLILDSDFNWYPFIFFQINFGHLPQPIPPKWENIYKLILMYLHNIIFLILFHYENALLFCPQHSFLLRLELLVSNIIKGLTSIVHLYYINSIKYRLNWNCVCINDRSGN